MEEFPKLGMTYNQVATRLKKDSKYRFMPNARASLLRQCQLCEGDKATAELIRDVSSPYKVTNNCSLPRQGYSSQYASRYDSIKW